MILSKRYYDNVSPVSESYESYVLSAKSSVLTFARLGTFPPQLLKYLISQIATGYSIRLCIDDFCYIIALRRRFVFHFNEARRFRRIGFEEISGVG